MKTEHLGHLKFNLQQQDDLGREVWTQTQPLYA